MTGIVCKGPSHMHRDNQSVLAITEMQEHTLKMKSSSLDCHLMKEVIAKDD